MTLTEVINSGDRAQIREALNAAPLAELRQAYRDLLLSGNKPEIVRQMETVLQARQQRVAE